MSFVIANGFRCSTSSLDEMVKHIAEFRMELAPLAKAHIAEFCARYAVRFIDDHYLRGRDDEKGRERMRCPLSAAWSELLDRARKVEREKVRDPEVDVECSITFIPFEGALYGMVFTEQNEFLDRWMQKPFVEDFHYQNRTDRPRNVSEYDWEERSRVWNGIFGSGIFRSAPALVGFAAACVDTLPSAPMPEEVLPHVPSDDSRLERVAFDIVSGRFMKEHGAQELSERKLWPLAMRAMSYIRETEEGRAAVTAEIARLRPLLRTPLTKEDLLGSR